MSIGNLLESPGYIAPSDERYFYGRLLREESDHILNKHGCQNNLFLLRESVLDTGSFVLSVCYQKKILNYKIIRQEDGMVAMRYSTNEFGLKFAGPIELLHFYQLDARNLITAPILPCNRPPLSPPVNYLFINEAEFFYYINVEITKSLTKKRTSWSDPEYKLELANAKGRYRYKYERIVLDTLHVSQQWYLKEADRETATTLLNKSGMVNGKFMVRGDEINGNNYKISVCYENKVWKNPKLFTTIL